MLNFVVFLTFSFVMLLLHLFPTQWIEIQNTWFANANMAKSLSSVFVVVPVPEATQICASDRCLMFDVLVMHT